MAILDTAKPGVNAFSQLDLNEGLQQVIAQMGFTEMTPIQAAAIPLLLSGRDLIGQSQTGSGKTAAFILPILQKLDLATLKPQALILCPTRELCDQVLRECRKFSKALPGFRSVALVGGQDYPPQKLQLTKGVHLVVGTPGRTLEHLLNLSVPLSALKTLILDEADRMLESGFTEEMTQILELLPSDRQTAFFSATYPASVEALSKSYQTRPEKINIAAHAQKAPSIQQYLYTAENPAKMATLIKILQQHPSASTLIFCRTKATVASIGTMLAESKVSSQVLHGDLEQSERDRATALFRNGSVRVLVATDVAARGLDIESLELVINVDLPSTPDVYIHRIGRTGRAGRGGTAVSIATAYEVEKVAEIEALTGVKMTRQKLGAPTAAANAGRAPKLAVSLQKSATKTIQISGGRLDKLRPGDILGALTAEPNPFLGTQIGKIEIHDRFSYVAVDSSIVVPALAKLGTVKIKGSKFKAYLVE